MCLLWLAVVDGIMWWSGRDSSFLASHHTPGPERQIKSRRRGERRLGGFQCTSLFASASKRDCHAVPVCVSVYVSVCVWWGGGLRKFPFLPPPLTQSAEGAERWDVVIVTVSQFIGATAMVSDPVESSCGSVHFQWWERCGRELVLMADTKEILDWSSSL